jgi:hypothetical protein
MVARTCISSPPPRDPMIEPGPRFALHTAYLVFRLLPGTNKRFNIVVRVFVTSPTTAAMTAAMRGVVQVGYCLTFHMC